MERARLRRYLRHGTLPQLVAFEATARLGSCSRAAELLHQSQPTVSIHIKKLSDSFGQPLFERAGRGMRLTLAGQAVYDMCRVLFATLEALDDRLTGQAWEAGSGPGAGVTALPSRPVSPHPVSLHTVPPRPMPPHHYLPAAAFTDRHARQV